jgi:ADP-L-glycero-D-manno-heptose 6-epimerase
VRLFRSCRPDCPDGGQQRDFIYVRDVATVVAWLVGREDVDGLFNLGSGQARSFQDLANAVFRAAGREPAIEFVDMPPELRAHYQYFTEAGIERLRAAGFADPMTPLEAGVSDYVNRFLSNADPYR